MSKIIDGIAKDLKAIPETLKAKTAGVDKEAHSYESPAYSCRLFL